MSEQHEILRRIAERGLQLAQEAIADPLQYVELRKHWQISTWVNANKKHLDLWQHMLNEIQQLTDEGSGK